MFFIFFCGNEKLSVAVSRNQRRKNQAASSGGSDKARVLRFFVIVLSCSLVILREISKNTRLMFVRVSLSTIEMITPTMK